MRSAKERIKKAGASAGAKIKRWGRKEGEYPILIIAGEEVIMDELSIDPTRYQHSIRVPFSEKYFPRKAEETSEQYIARLDEAANIFKEVFGPLQGAKGSTVDPILTPGPKFPLEPGKLKVFREGIENRIESISKEIIEIRTLKHGMLSLDLTSKLKVLEILQAILEKSFEDERERAGILVQPPITLKERDEIDFELVKRFAALFLQGRGLVDEKEEWKGLVEQLFKILTDEALKEGVEPILGSWTEAEAKKGDEERRTFLLGLLQKIQGLSQDAASSLYNALIQDILKESSGIPEGIRTKVSQVITGEGFGALTDTKAKLTFVIREIAKGVLESEAKAEAIRKEINEKKSEIDSLKAQLLSFGEKIKALNEEKEEISFDKNMSLFDKDKEKAAAIQSAKEGSRQQLELLRMQTEEQVQKLQNQIITLEANLQGFEEAKARLVDQGATIEEQTGQIAAQGAEIQALKEQITGLQENIQTARTEKGEIESERVQLENQLKELNNQLTQQALQATGTSQVAQQAAQTLQTQITSLTSQLQNIEQQAQEKNQQISNLQANLEEKTKKLGDAQAAAQSARSSAAAAQTALRAAQGQLATAEQAAAAAASRLQGLEKELSTARSDVAKLSGQTSDEKAAKEAAERKVRTLQDEIASTKDELDNAQSDIRQKENEVASLRRENEASKAATAAAIAASTASITASASKISELNRTLTTITSRITGLESELEQAKGELERARRDKETTESRGSRATQEKDYMIQKLDEKVTGLEQTIATMTKEKDNTLEYLDSLKTSLNENRSPLPQPGQGITARSALQELVSSISIMKKTAPAADQNMCFLSFYVAYYLKLFFLNSDIFETRKEVGKLLYPFVETELLQTPLPSGISIEMILQSLYSIIQEVEARRGKTGELVYAAINDANGDKAKVINYLRRATQGAFDVTQQIHKDIRRIVQSSLSGLGQATPTAYVQTFFTSGLEIPFYIYKNTITPFSEIKNEIYRLPGAPQEVKDKVQSTTQTLFLTYEYLILLFILVSRNYIVKRSKEGEVDCKLPFIIENFDKALQSARPSANSPLGPGGAPVLAELRPTDIRNFGGLMNNSAATLSLKGMNIIGPTAMTVQKQKTLPQLEPMTAKGFSGLMENTAAEPSLKGSAFDFTPQPIQISAPPRRPSTPAAILAQKIATLRTERLVDNPDMYTNAWIGKSLVTLQQSLYSRTNSASNPVLFTQIATLVYTIYKGLTTLSNKNRTQSKTVDSTLTRYINTFNEFLSSGTYKLCQKDNKVFLGPQGACDGDLVNRQNSSVNLHMKLNTLDIEPSFQIPAKMTPVEIFRQYILDKTGQIVDIRVPVPTNVTPRRGGGATRKLFKERSGAKDQTRRRAPRERGATRRVASRKRVGTRRKTGRRIADQE